MRATSNLVKTRMRRESAAAGWAPAIDTSSSVPRLRQLYLQLREGILTGALRQGDRLPSTRSASVEWQLSRGAVSEVYETLIAEGYLVGRSGSGTYVTRNIRDGLRGVSSHLGRASVVGPRKISRAVEQATQLSTDFPLQAAFTTGRVAHDERTAVLLKKLAHRHVEQARDGYRDPQGEQGLREAVTAYLTASRGVRCTAAQVFILSGTQQALDLSIRTLLSPGDTALIEDPCYPPARQALVLNGARIVGIPVDEDGMITRTLETYEGPAPALVYVTPSNQYPCGSALSLTRRMQLLAFAQEKGAWIIEDDYDSEFRYEGRPIAALQGLDRHDRVIHVGSFSKALMPGLRVGFMVVPLDLVPAFRAVRPILDRFPASLPQRVVADFLNEGYFPAHLRRLRENYRHSRDLLARLIQEELGEHLIVQLPKQGVHMTVTSTGTWTDDRHLTRIALDEGVVVTPMSPMHIERVECPRLLLGFSGLGDEEAEVAVQRLSKALERR
ncbi:PLP-dependent aminotransferase family protein [Pseudomonas sp. RC10]|uniref:MocR-like pyridoxine biosynthesis transcription factor PdxR n=1 Tax=Pseudomonas bambusae TaxID=3139142 RepID=UPI003138B651